MCPPVSYVVSLKTGLEGIRDVFYALVVGGKIYDDHVEPAFFLQAVAHDECLGRCNQKALFAGRHHFPGQNIKVAASGFNFGDHQKPVILGNDIDLLMFEPPVSFPNAKSLTLKMPCCKGFTLTCQFTFFVNIFHGEFETFRYAISNNRAHGREK